MEENENDSEITKLWKRYTKQLAPLRQYSLQDGVLAKLHDANIYVSYGHFDIAATLLRLAQKDLNQLWLIKNSRKNNS